jgi:hypothetical protein
LSAQLLKPNAEEERLKRAVRYSHHGDEDCVRKLDTSPEGKAERKVLFEQLDTSAHRWGPVREERRLSKRALEHAQKHLDHILKAEKRKREKGERNGRTGQTGKHQPASGG